MDDFVSLLDSYRIRTVSWTRVFQLPAWPVLLRKGSYNPSSQAHMQSFAIDLSRFERHPQY